MSTYWHEKGKNMLRGVEGDTDNPPRTSVHDIAYALRMSMKARADFETAYNELDDEEKARIEDLLASNPRMTSLLGHASDDFLDRVQNKWNRQGVQVGRFP